MANWSRSDGTKNKERNMAEHDVPETDEAGETKEELPSGVTKNAKGPLKSSLGDAFRSQFPGLAARATTAVQNAREKTAEVVQDVREAAAEAGNDIRIGFLELTPKARRAKKALVVGTTNLVENLDPILKTRVRRTVATARTRVAKALTDAAAKVAPKGRTHACGPKKKASPRKPAAKGKK